MRKAEWKDKSLFCEIFTQVFSGNTGTTWVLRKNINPEKALRRLARYSYIKGMVKDGVYFSDNGKGIAICYKFNNNRFSLRHVWSEIIFAITAMDLRKLPQILSRESYREKKRPASGEYLYFWFLGALPSERSAALELGKDMLKEADRLGLPIYLETAVERLKPAYERYGFETYHYWQEKEKDIQFWFLKRETKAR